MLKELEVEECDAIGSNQGMKVGHIKNFDQGLKI